MTESRLKTMSITAIWLMMPQNRRLLRRLERVAGSVPGAWSSSRGSSTFDEDLVRGLPEQEQAAGEQHDVALLLMPCPNRGADRFLRPLIQLRRGQRPSRVSIAKASSSRRALSHARAGRRPTRIE